MIFSQIGKFKFPIACGEFGVVQIASPFSNSNHHYITNATKEHQRLVKLVIYWCIRLNAICTIEISLEMTM
jgi:hypothetical protein